jgi:hypothetical protein
VQLLSAFEEQLLGEDFQVNINSSSTSAAAAASSTSVALSPPKLPAIATSPVSPSKGSHRHLNSMLHSSAVSATFEPLFTSGWSKLTHRA